MLQTLEASLCFVRAWLVGTVSKDGAAEAMQTIAEEHTFPFPAGFFDSFIAALSQVECVGWVPEEVSTEREVGASSFLQRLWHGQDVI